jgi:hypothetical protein
MFPPTISTQLLPARDTVTHGVINTDVNSSELAHFARLVVVLIGDLSQQSQFVNKRIYR